MELPDLLALLKANGVLTYQQADLRIEFAIVGRVSPPARHVLKADSADDGQPPPQDAVTAALNPPRFDPDQVDEG